MRGSQLVWQVARGSFLAVVLGAWAAYVTLIGGDVFPAYRHMLPVLAMLVLLACECLRSTHLMPDTRWTAA